MDEVKMDQREEREHLDRAFASNDKVQFDNVIAQSNARNNNGIEHTNNVSKYAELALSNAVNFQAQMNQEYLKNTAQEREHSNETYHMSAEHANEMHHMAVEHNDLRYHHTIENDRYTLDRLYSVFPEEAAGLKMVIQSFVDEAVAKKVK